MSDGSSSLVAMSSSEPSRLSVWCGTWNMHAVCVGGKALEEPSTLKDWIAAGDAKYDVFAIATQEAERSIFQSVVLTSAKPRWEAALRSLFDIRAAEDDNEYSVVAMRSCGAVHLAVVVRRELVARVKHVRSAVVRAGFIHGFVPNKGAVGVACTIGDTSFLFVSAHLSPHASAKAVAHRNKQFAWIDEGLHSKLVEPASPSSLASAARRVLEGCRRGARSAPGFEDGSDGRPTASAAFDRIFVMGDLNYRVDITKDGMRACNPLPQARAHPPSPRVELKLYAAEASHHVRFTFESCVPAVAVLAVSDAATPDPSLRSEAEHAALRAAQQQLLAADQQWSTARPHDPSGPQRAGFKEPPITFWPTYKFDRKSGYTRYKLQHRSRLKQSLRLPSWTDRVLYRASDEGAITPVEYDACTAPSLRVSDHQPVFATFEVRLSARRPCLHAVEEVELIMESALDGGSSPPAQPAGQQTIPFRHSFATVPSMDD